MLRAGQVFRLFSESGELEALNMNLEIFMSELERKPSELLDLEVLEIVAESEHALEPGDLLVAHPPFVMEESENGVQLEAMGVLEALEYYAELSAQIRSLARGQELPE